MRSHGARQNFRTFPSVAVIRYSHSAQNETLQINLNSRGRKEGSASSAFSDMKLFGEPGVESNYTMDVLHLVVKQESMLVCNLMIHQGCS